MNKEQKQRFANYISDNGARIKSAPFLKTGENRSHVEKIANYREVQDLLRQYQPDINADKKTVLEGVNIISHVLGRVIEIEDPETDNSEATRKSLISLEGLKRDSSNVTLLQNSVEVHLDIDQLKHQHPTKPIGTRQKGGGNRFKDICDADWHKKNTMVHMADWANSLSGMTTGEKRYHGQSRPENGIHYEGFCLMAGKKYVLFHCYPANDNSKLKY